MISDVLIPFTNNYFLPLHFLIHSTIFVAILYTAVHNREIPELYITPFWYVGVVSFLISTSIIIQLFLGPEFIFSYWNMGHLLETIHAFGIAAIAVIMFSLTFKNDVQNRNKRQK